MDIGNLEVVHSATTKEDRDQAVSWAGHKVESHIEQRTSELEALEVPVNRREKYTRVIEDCKRVISGIHQRYGVELPKDPFPNVYFFDDTHMNELRELGYFLDEATIGEHDGVTGAALIKLRSGPGSEILNYSVIFHEMFHNIGRTVTAVFEESPKIREVVAGYMVDKKGKGEMVGELIEEAIVDYFTKQYLSSLGKGIETEKKDFVDSIKTKWGDKGAKVLRNNESEGELLLLGMRLTKDEIYTAYGDVALALNVLAQKKGKSEEFSRLFLAARVDTSKKRRFYELLTELVGRDKAKEIMTLSPHSEEERGKIKELSDKLYDMAVIS